jgi:hypothetical protein
VTLLYLDPYKVRFYGGPGSAEYTAVWISSNGWLSFYDPEHPTQPNPSPNYGRGIPDTEGINCFIAPWWCDLKPLSQGYIKISYGWVDFSLGYGATRTCLAISWNATDSYGNPQIFQVLLERSAPYLFMDIPMRNSEIYFQYKSIAFCGYTTVGVEDQGGWKGTSYDYHDVQNQKMLICGDLYQY